MDYKTSLLLKVLLRCQAWLGIWRIWVDDNKLLLFLNMLLNKGVLGFRQGGYIFRYDFYDHGEVDVPLDFYRAIFVNVKSQMKELEE